MKIADFDDQRINMRGYLLPLLLSLLLGLLLVRLVILQIFQGAYYRNLADNNRVRTTIIHAPRGIIFDRHDTPLVFNIPGFRQTINDKTRLLTRKEALSLIASGKNDLEVDSLREYPYQEAFAHVLGYIGQISQEELNNSLFLDYQAGDWVGKMGIEKEYERKLRGIDGKELVEVNALGKVQRVLGQTDPIPGENITLTIDAKLQDAAFKALKDAKKGVLIVSTPKGEILSLVSKPSFDPNVFTLGEHYLASSSSYTNVSQILLDSQNQPLVNRAISEVYPPGSIFKIITAAAGLEDKVIDEHFQIQDLGVLTVGAFSFSNWYYTQYGKTEGLLNVVGAIKRSNDIFFYKLAEMLGVERLSSMARKFGLGEKLGIDLDGEVKGLVPSEAWKKKFVGDAWFLGDTYHYGIGQGYLLTTPLQVNVLTQAIANDGLIYKPHLLQSQKSKVKSQKFLSQKTVDLIRQGMIESCSPGGVAWPLFKLKIKNEKLKIDRKNYFEPSEATVSANFKDQREIVVACKTGTAQHGGVETLPHAWITLFAPAYNPQIVMTVLVESSGEGSNVAAPIAKKILEEWFER